MHINFNPNNLFDLDIYGTVYPTAEIKDAFGQLTATSTGMLMTDWQVITLPMPETADLDSETIQGYGWMILLNEHWKLVKIDDRHYSLAEEN